jgi:hypothetical protein
VGGAGAGFREYARCGAGGVSLIWFLICCKEIRTCGAMYDQKVCLYIVVLLGAYMSLKAYGKPIGIIIISVSRPLYIAKRPNDD